MIKTRNGAAGRRSYGRVNSMQVHKREVVEQVAFQVRFEGFLARDNPQVTQKNVPAEWNKVTEAFFAYIANEPGRTGKNQAGYQVVKSAHPMKA